MRQHSDGIALVFARTDTKAVQAALHATDAALFLAGRLTFLKGAPPFEPATQNAGAPSMLLGYGKWATAKLAAYSAKRAGILYRRGDGLSEAA
jgi:hypothetical protein